jgi:hypothetical protein
MMQAIMKEMKTADPASFPAVPRIEKMPAAIIPPTPIDEADQKLIFFEVFFIAVQFARLY